MGGALKVLQEKKVKNLVLVGFMAQLGPNAMQIYISIYYRSQIIAVCLFDTITCHMSVKASIHA